MVLHIAQPPLVLDEPFETERAAQYRSLNVDLRFVWRRCYVYNVCPQCGASGLRMCTGNLTGNSARGSDSVVDRASCSNVSPGCSTEDAGEPDSSGTSATVGTSSPSGATLIPSKFVSRPSVAPTPPVESLPSVLALLVSSPQNALVFALMFSLQVRKFVPVSLIGYSSLRLSVNSSSKGDSSVD